MSALYIHIPFCQKKCLYCSFVVSVGQDHRRDEYVDCVSLEAKKYQGNEIRSVYLGGGTPSQLGNGQLAKLISMIRENFFVLSDAEWTIEANPEDLILEKAKFLFDLGIDRVSFGAQSLNNKYLKYLGRCHDEKKVYEAFAHLRKAGFNNINVDLMCSFPGQTKDEVAEDVKKVCQMQGEHISLYSLTIEENSRFFVRDVQLQSSEYQADHYALIVNLIEKSGYKQYEVSNFARQGRESLHNMNYWQGGNYIGLGVGAHSHIDGRRFWNVSGFKDYLGRMSTQQSPEEGFEALTPRNRFMERLLFGLRMNSGVIVPDIEKEFGYTLDEAQQSIIKDSLKEGYLMQENNYLKTTLRGRLVLDELSMRLI